MNILITGGMGHIGSYLLESNVFKDHNVTVVDNMSTQRYVSIKALGKATFIEDDFNNLSKSFLHKFHVIIHLAAITDAASSFDNKDNLDKINKEDTIFFFSKITSGQLIIFPSSTSVYGSATYEVNEKSNTNPQSPYASAKLAVENYLLTTNKNYIIFRFGTIFGTSPGMRFHTAINKFCYQFKLGQELTVWKENLNMKRPYLGLGDMAKALNLAIDNKLCSGEIYNVVSENKKLQKILDIFKRHGELKINLVDTPLLNQFSYNVSALKLGKFKWYPKEKIIDGISSTLNWLGFNGSANNRS